jgi:hypothetical protein
MRSHSLSSASGHFFTEFSQRCARSWRTLPNLWLRCDSRERRLRLVDNVAEYPASLATSAQLVNDIPDYAEWMRLRETLIELSELADRRRDITSARSQRVDYILDRLADGFLCGFLGIGI